MKKATYFIFYVWILFRISDTTYIKGITFVQTETGSDTTTIP